jgi:hypothetical protein
LSGCYGNKSTSQFLVFFSFFAWTTLYSSPLNPKNSSVAIFYVEYKVTWTHYTNCVNTSWYGVSDLPLFFGVLVDTNADALCL